MLNLIKYELIKKYKLFSIAIIFSLGLNVYLMTTGVAGSIAFIAFFPVVAAILYIVDVIRMYSDDLNKKSGYMLFMTPNSGYKIVISKLVTAVLEVLAILLIYFVFILLNGVYIMYASQVNVSLSEAMTFIFDVTNFININLADRLGINLSHVFLALLTLFVFLIGFITTVYTAVTIRKSLFSEIKLGAVLSFLIFLMLNWVLINLSTNIYNSMTPWYEQIIYSSINTTVQAFYMTLPINAFSIIQIIVLTFCSGYLLENKINL